MKTRNELVEHLLQSYEPYYNITRISEEEVPLEAECIFHAHSSKYVLVKKAVLWDADSHEYLYVFSAPHFTKELYDRCHQFAYDKGMQRVDPRPGHMYSYITTVYLCDSCDSEVRTAVKKCRIRKSFRFSFRGWMEFHVSLIEGGSSRITTNAAAKESTKFFRRLLQY